MTVEVAIIVLLIFPIQEWQREEQAEWLPKVEFQGDALSDAEKNVIKEAVTGEIIPYKLEYDHINISVKSGIVRERLVFRHAHP